MKTAWVVLCHELRDALRDTRLLALTIGMGVLFPVGFNVALERFMTSESESRRGKELEVVVVHAERAPSLVSWLSSNAVRIVTVEGPLDEALRARRHDVALEIAADFQEAWRASRPARVDVVFDRSQPGTSESVERLRTLLTGYSRLVGETRLSLHGVAPDLSRALLVGARDVSTPRARAAFLLFVVPFFLFLGAIMGAGQVAVDLTAGERERQSLEPLLATSASRGGVMLGKIGAAATFGVGIAACEVLLMMVAGSAVRSNIYRIELSQALPLLAVVVPVAVVGAAALTSLAAFSKTVREAQAGMAAIMLVPAAPMLYLMSVQPKATLGTYAVPFLSQYQLCIDILRGDLLSPAHLLVSAASSLALFGALAWFGSRLYHRERLTISA